MKTFTHQCLLTALLSMLVATGALTLYDRLVIRPALVVGVVDLADVYRAKETEFTLMVTKTGLDEDRQKALRMAQAFAQRLPLALEELPAECNCLVVLKSAVAGSPHTLDLTPMLRRKVGVP